MECPIGSTPFEEVRVLGVGLAPKLTLMLQEGSSRSCSGLAAGLREGACSIVGDLRDVSKVCTHGLLGIRRP